MSGKDPKIIEDHPFASLFVMCATSVYLTHKSVHVAAKIANRHLRVKEQKRRWMKKFQP